MSQQKSKETDGEPGVKLPMDLKHLKSLIELMVDNDLSRMELREGDSHILLRRGQPALTTAPPAVHPILSAPNPPADSKVGAPVAATEVQDELLIRSPMVGTFYASADPESPPFVNIGSIVEPDTVVCLIEAMKVFNELKAEVAGRITRVLVKTAEAVEFDQPLFAVSRA
jgi:acetyl-CoA carboxylase biotin carboxyl carrier protein